MLTLDELQAAEINANVAREAHTQAQKRLEDALATKASHEQKAFALLAALVTMALALFGAFGALGAGTLHLVAPAFLVAGACCTAGAVLAGIALLPATYGALGSDPSAWLRPGIIDGNEKALSATLAYETFFHKQRIHASEQSNRRKARLVRAAIICGLASPAALCIAALWLG